MRIEDFDALPDAEAAAALRACADVPGWVDALVAGRPYGSAETLVVAADERARAWTPADVEVALADHPRIGEKAAGTGVSADHSRVEQAGVDAADPTFAERMRAGNLRYEERFGRIYLVRAKGRTGEEMLAFLEQRLGNDEATELAVTAGQLREIALLRLRTLLGEDEA